MRAQAAFDPPDSRVRVMYTNRSTKGICQWPGNIIYQSHRDSTLHYHNKMCHHLNGCWGEYLIIIQHIPSLAGSLMEPTPPSAFSLFTGKEKSKLTLWPLPYWMHFIFLTSICLPTFTFLSFFSLDLTAAFKLSYCNPVVDAQGWLTRLEK